MQLPERPVRGVAVVGGGGALGVTASDTAEIFGIELPLLTPETQEKIMAILPKPGSSATNPVDAANPGVPPEILKEVLLKSGEEKTIDLQILIQLFYIYKSIIRLGEMTLDEATPYRGLDKGHRRGPKEKSTSRLFWFCPTADGSWRIWIWRRSGAGPAGCFLKKAF